MAGQESVHTLQKKEAPSAVTLHALLFQSKTLKRILFCYFKLSLPCLKLSASHQTEEDQCDSWKIGNTVLQLDKSKQITGNKLMPEDAR